MAKRKVNKSAAVRLYITTHPSASVNEVVAGLAQEGIKVAPQIVYKQKNTTVKRRTGKQWKQQHIKKAAATTSPVSVDDLLAVKNVGRSLGADKAIAALQALKKLDLLPA